MGKQLKFTKKEQKTITNCLMCISEILFLKMDNGVDSPNLSGEIEVTDQNKMITFEIEANKND